MKNFVKYPYLAAALVFMLFIACKQSDSPKKGNETILKGKTTMLVDETLKPIIDDQVEVFESKYDAKITLVAKSERELINAMLNDTSSIAVLSRPLSGDEAKAFQSKKIVPKTTKIGTDAIAFISSKSRKDTLIALEDVIMFLQGKEQSSVKGLVFDNPNSSTVRYMNDLAGLKEMREKDVFSFKTNEDVIKYVSENEGMIGVLGVNWLSQPTADMRKIIKNINVLNVKSLNNIGYFAPSQNNIAEGKYPLARDLYIINCQGYSGLGMGFASFVAGDIGQRIILKSGLLPVRVPGRNMIIRNSINIEPKK
ncbi:PstS family phosphate ABC transporter substrate-binding protein [Flavobacterium frigoris]|uniref:Phosphate ABC transporter, phosphate-binding component n=1 Tax=Flavobacterium frigoris (strain PS1) TaxID=1086011 RepID=H7FMS2_FLAFP|nr:substrate-binding domain-containing protein [Flavobacterium frigoris]EIA10173.1 putative phosphate ABC transporter, phosphate-binding component [Flavobacterium frigoris PS1]